MEIYAEQIELISGLIRIHFDWESGYSVSTWSPGKRTISCIRETNFHSIRVTTPVLKYVLKYVPWLSTYHTYSSSSLTEIWRLSSCEQMMLWNRESIKPWSSALCDKLSQTVKISNSQGNQKFQGLKRLFDRQCYLNIYYLHNRKRLTDLENEIMVTSGQGWRRGTVREFGMDMHTQLYLKWITSKDYCIAHGTLLNVTWQPGWEGRLGENGYM